MGENGSVKSSAEQLAELRIKGLAFAGLVAIQTTIGITYKIAAAGGAGGSKFAFSTTSAITMSEFVKLSLSSCFHLVAQWRTDSVGTEHSPALSVIVQRAASAAYAQLDKTSAMHILLLSFLYTVNNQLSLYIYILADPGSIYLFKAGSTLFVAVLQFLLLGRSLLGLQWVALMLQLLGIIVVQYNPCKGVSILPQRAYFLLAISVLITGITSVRNEYLVKNYKIDLNVQNAILYGGGFAMNLFSFFCLPNPNDSKAGIGFFEGYDTLSAKGVVVTNAFIGLAITLVYKYADAVVKMIATDCTTMILMIFSAVVLNFPSTPLTWGGVCVTLLAIHIYAEAAKWGVETKALQAKVAELQKQAAGDKEDKGPFLDTYTGQEGSTNVKESAKSSSKVVPSLWDSVNAENNGRTLGIVILVLTLIAGGIAGYLSLRTVGSELGPEEVMTVGGQNTTRLQGV